MWEKRLPILLTPSTKPPLMPVHLHDDGESDESKQSTDDSETMAKSNFPPRSSSSRRKHKKKDEFEENLIASPETPAHQRPFTATSEEDLSFTDFSSLDDYFRDSAQPYHVPPGANPASAFAKRYPEEEKKMADRSCMAAGGLIFRRKKVSSVDVASVGNASDTMISVTDDSHMSGRDLHEKAKMYFNEGAYDHALPLFEAILSAQVRRFSALHPSVGAAMHNVGVCRQRLRQHDLAENLFFEAVEIRRQTLGRDHLEVAASLSKLGSTRVALRKFDAAHENLKEALKIARQKLGEQHKTVAQILGHLGCFYFEVGELYASQTTFQEALDIYREVWSKVNDRDACMAQLTDTLCNIGSIQNRRKRHTSAIESFSEALDLQRGILGHDDPRVLATLDNLGYSYSKHKDYGNALSCYRKLLRAQISRSGTFTEDCFESFRKQLLMYEKLKMIQDAVNETKEILQLQKSTLHADHVLVTKTKQLLQSLEKKNDRMKEKKQDS